MVIRLGVGELFDPAAKVPTPMADGRRFFLEAVKVAPAVLESLKEELLPLYEEAVDQDRVATWEGPPVLTGEDSELERRLVDWSRRYHLNESWILDSALLTLRFFSRGVKTKYFVVPAQFRSHPEFPPLQFEEPAWIPDLHTKKQYMTRARSNFEKELQDYVQSIEAKLRALGWKKTPQKRLAKPLQHFEWLVQYQCAGWSQGRIGEEYKAGQKTVSEALKRTADLIGLTLRPRGKGGRPPSHK